MITFKELNKFNQIADINESSIAIKNAEVQYSVFNTQKNVLHLFYNGNYRFDIENKIDLLQYDKVILDFSGADDFLLRFFDIDSVKDKLIVKEIYIISKNIFEKPGYMYNDPIMHRIKILDFEITNTIKQNSFFFLGGHARWHRLLFLNKLLKRNQLHKLNWSCRRVEQETPTMLRSCIPLEYVNIYKDLEIHKLLPKSLDFDVHSQAEYHGWGDASIFNNPGYIANLDFYRNSYVEIISESVFEFAINPAKKDKEYFIVSEKTFKPMALGFPFMGLLLPKTFSKFKEWGFQLFDELIDYSFDDEYDDEKRMNMIVEQVCNNDIENKFNTHFESIKNKQIYNRKIFIELKSRLLKNYEKVIV